MKVNHKSLKLGVAFALVSTVGITSAEIIKQELSKPIVAVEEITTTESPEKIKYKKEVQEFSKTMRPVVAKYGVTDEKLDELVNKWLEKRIYQGYRDEFNDETKKTFIEYIMNVTVYNLIVKSVDKAIDIVKKANYFDENIKEKWISNMKEYKEDQSEDTSYQYGYYTRARYYETDRQELIQNYPQIFENVINNIKDERLKSHISIPPFTGVSNLVAFSQMLEEKEILQDKSLNEDQKNKLLDRMDDILENRDISTYDNGNITYEALDNLIQLIRGVHTSENTSEISEQFSEEKARGFIRKIEREKFETKVEKLKVKTKELLELERIKLTEDALKEGIDNEKIKEYLETSFIEATRYINYHFGMNFNKESKSLLDTTVNNFKNKVKALKMEIKVRELLNSYLTEKKQELEKYEISEQNVSKIISDILGRYRYHEEFSETFDDVVERVFKDSKKEFNDRLIPFKNKYIIKERFKEYTLSKKQELLKEKITDEFQNNAVNEVLEHLDTEIRYGEKLDTYLDRVLNEVKEQYHDKILKEIIRLNVEQLKKEQEHKILADNRYTETEKKRIILEFGRLYYLGHYLDSIIDSHIKELKTMPFGKVIGEIIKDIKVRLSRVYYSAPVTKNKFTINNVGFNEKLEINQDNSLSMSEKLALQLQVDELVEAITRKIDELNLISPNKDTKPRAMTAEELAVFIEQIQNIHKAKVVNNANEGFKPKEEKIEKPLLEKPAPTQPVHNGGTIAEKPSVLPESKPVQPTETTSTIELKPVVSTEKEEKTTEVTSNKVETTKENEETTKEVVSHNKWEKKGNHWYYVDNDGKAVNKQWIGSYYIKADKTMAENEWIYDAKYNSWFYLDENGHYVENTWKDQYYLKSGGYMAKNEWIFDSSYNSWYYLNEDGSYARNQWIQSNGKWYYVLSNGKMAKNTVIDGYQLNENGEWV